MPSTNAGAVSGVFLVFLVAVASSPGSRLLDATSVPEPRCIKKERHEMRAGPLTLPVSEDVGTRVLLEDLGDVYDPGKVNFALEFGDEVTPYSIMSFMIEPSGTIEIEVLLGEEMREYELDCDGGTLSPIGQRAWTWVAPTSHGVHRLLVRELGTGETMRLNALVTRGYSHESPTIGEFRIGKYPAEPFREIPAYDRPPGLVEVDREILDLRLTPHFVLRQFMSKQDGGWPQYVLIQPRLLLKLEMVLEEINEMGVPASTLSVLSGFRTPYYNQLIGNKTRYSRHHYGDAADVFVDVDGNGVMDDLDGDGRHSIRDAQIMAGIVDSKLNEA